MTAGRLSLAIAAGLLLATMPLWRYARLGDLSESHMDHEPHHGGQLGMVGDAHVEIVRSMEQVEVHVSDAWRRPLRPLEGWVVFDDVDRRPLRWGSRCLVGADKPDAHEIETFIVLADGTSLQTSFELAEP